MTDDLKDRFEQLVADPPPPTGVPSQAVAARVRTVRRRRTAGVVTLAAAAVVAIAVAAGNLTDIDSAPPVTNTPSAPVTVVTGPPTAAPTTIPPSPVVTHTVGPTGSTKTGGTTGTTAGATTGHTQGTGTTKTPPARPPLSAHVKLNPIINGRTVTMRVTVSGTVLVPTVEGKNLPADTSFLNLSGGTQYYWGDGEEGGSDGGSMSCDGAKTRKTGQETYTAETHTYTKPGTYTFRYTVRYCNIGDTVKTVKVTVK
ncbi:hypothetical protein E0H75_27210 [Kribbella capetownensis]|uniref:PKD domain-containing protein n=1 Tax=Kribbella capetownensis TaxID=1572659 RepID=A0A4R0JP84_9ACTN|nr:hypothetical protein [Kribbella capetownensis]TCC46738.1 hypothetical protein E0H75_27210 [Kribbella capetownensis]